METVNQKLIFKITGKLDLKFLSKYEIESKRERSIETDILSSFRESLTSEYFQKALSPLLNGNEVTNLNTDIQFAEGSILALGIVVIEYCGKAAGFIAFCEYVKKFIKFTLESSMIRRLQRSLFNFEPYSRLDIQRLEQEIIFKEDFITVTLISNPPLTDNPMHSVVNTSRTPESAMPFSLLNILKAITIINILLFIGGTVGGIFTVHNIEDQYKEAQAIIEKAKTNYDDASKELTLVKTYYLENLENIRIKLDTVANKITVTMNAKSAVVADSLNKVNTSIGQMKRVIALQSRQINDLSSTIAQAKRVAQQLTTQLAVVKSQKTTFPLWNIWVLANGWTKIVFGIISFFALISLVLLGRAFGKQA